MKISVITVCYNSAATIGDTINSIARQSYSNKEYIVIDGNSSDATMEIVRTSSCVSRFVSERDNGIYDAMNKGVSLATGEVVGTLNADDFYANDDVLTEVANVFLDPTVEACYGDLVYVKQDSVDQVVRFWKSRDYESGLFKAGWMPAHPTFFVRKSVYDKLGSFDLNYKIAADFELLFRFIEQNRINTKYLPRLLVKMRLGGTTNKNLSNIIRQNKEIIAILTKHYGDFSTIKFVFIKLVSRLLQFFRRPKAMIKSS